MTDEQAKAWRKQWVKKYHDADNALYSANNAAKERLMEESKQHQTHYSKIITLNRGVA